MNPSDNKNSAFCLESVLSETISSVRESDSIAVRPEPLQKLQIEDTNEVIEWSNIRGSNRFFIPKEDIEKWSTRDMLLYLRKQLQSQLNVSLETSLVNGQQDFMILKERLGKSFSVKNIHPKMVRIMIDWYIDNCSSFALNKIGYIKVKFLYSPFILGQFYSYYVAKFGKPLEVNAIIGDEKLSMKSSVISEDSLNTKLSASLSSLILYAGIPISFLFLTKIKNKPEAEASNMIVSACVTLCSKGKGFFNQIKESSEKHKYPKEFFASAFLDEILSSIEDQTKMPFKSISIDIMKRTSKKCMQKFDIFAEKNKG